MSDAQEVILERTETGSEVSYRVTYEGDASSFGWLIVVPGTVTGVLDSSEARFDALRVATDPRIEVWSPSGSDDGGGGSSGCGCRGGDKGLVMSSADEAGRDLSAGSDNSVSVEAEGFAGPYVYTVLTADDTSALQDWLDEAGFDLGGTASTLDLYVEEGGFSFVAVSLAPDEALTPDGGRTLPPITVATDSDDLRFPARMALTGEPEWVRTVVWVEGPTRATVADGWREEMGSDLDADDQDPSEFYTEYLQSMARDEPLYLQVFSNEVDGVWVTRFDTFAARGVHTADVIFDFADDEDTNRLFISAVEPSGAWLLIPLLGLGWGLRRRPC